MNDPQSLSAYVKSINWSELRHAYGYANDASQPILNLASSDSSTREQSYEWFHSAIVHQGSRWQATAKVASCIIRLLVDPRTPERPKLLECLSLIAVGEDTNVLMGWFSIEDIRQEVARTSKMTDEELRNELDHWARSAAPEEREWRKLQAEQRKEDLTLELRDIPRWELESYDAVREGLPVYLSLLSAECDAVRTYSAYLVGWFPEEASASLEKLFEMLESERDPVVIATTSIAIGLLGKPDNDAAKQALQSLLMFPNRLIKWGAALGLGLMVETLSTEMRGLLEDCILNAQDERRMLPYYDGQIDALAEMILANLAGTLGQG